MCYGVYTDLDAVTEWTVLRWSVTSVHCVATLSRARKPGSLAGETNRFWNAPAVLFAMEWGAAIGITT